MSPDGKEILNLSAGSVMGEINLVYPERSHVNIRAKTAVVIQVMQKLIHFYMTLISPSTLQYIKMSTFFRTLGRYAQEVSVRLHS